MMVGRRVMLTLMGVCGIWIAVGLGIGSASVGASEFEFKRAFGSDGGSLSEFSGACSTATDVEGDLVYVLDCGANALFKFDLEGNPVPFGGSSANVTGNELSGLVVEDRVGWQQVAVDSSTHVIYVTTGEATFGSSAIQAFHADGDPAKFTKGPSEGTNEIGGFSGVRGVSVDSSGNIYVSGVQPAGSTNDIRIYGPTGAVLVESVDDDLRAPNNIAVDAHGLIYALQGEKVLRYTPSEYPIASTTTYKQEPVGPELGRSLAVNPLTNELFVLEAFTEEGEKRGRVVVLSETGVLNETFGGPGEDGELLAPEGIAVGIQAPDFALAFVGENPEIEPSRVKIFKEKEIIDRPTIELTAAEAVTSSSVKLRAKINPNNRETVYWFEYGLDDCSVISCTRIPLTGVPIGDGRKGVVVTQTVTGLEPGVTYHYRVVAENEIPPGPSEGPDKTFKTQGSSVGFVLSDARVWEMVSPSNKFGGTLLRGRDTAIQAAVSGDKLVYASQGSIVERPDGNRLLEPSTVLAKRDPSGLWSADDLTAPHTEATLVQGGTEFKLFSPELLEAGTVPRDSTPLSPEASERTPYHWRDGTPPQLTPLVNPSNVPAGTKFGPPPGATSILRFEGATPDLEQIVIRSDVAPLVANAAPGALYRWEDGDLEAVSELPESETVVEGVLGSGEGSVRHAISDDGSRIFWAPTAGGNYDVAGINLRALYVRDTTAGESSRLDVAEAGVSGGEERPAFNAASADGRVVFFTDSQRLTDNASPDGRDLYRCEIGQVGSGLGCGELTDISAPLEGSGESAVVMDQGSGLSEDGRRLYFVARGVLDETSNEEGEAASAGEPNLYLWEEGQGVRFIATLLNQDENVWGSAVRFTLRISATISPSGRYFAFTSEKSLTGYENVNSAGHANTEVFLYDAEAEAGRLACVSCNPSGVVAVGERIPQTETFLPQDPIPLWGGRWVAATLPEATQTEGAGRSLYRPRSVLDNGRVFFNSVDPLVPIDSNGNWDVYQYEPTNVGTCALGTSTASVSRSGAGCVGLLSSGTADGDSGFLDASASGDDVFFLTRGRLSALDEDEELDAYDARVNGIPAVLKPVQECAGEACQPAVGAPNDPTPASEAFNGAQTPVNCRKGQRKVHRHGKATCVRKKHKKKPGKHEKGKRASTNGRAGR